MTELPAPARIRPVADELDRDRVLDRPAEGAAEPMPAGIRPMLACLGKLPRDDAAHGYEIKWDGVRAIAHVDSGRFALTALGPVAGERHVTGLQRRSVLGHDRRERRVDRTLDPRHAPEARRQLHERRAGRL